MLAAKRGTHGSIVALQLSPASTTSSTYRDRPENTMILSLLENVSWAGLNSPILSK